MAEKLAEKVTRLAMEFEDAQRHIALCKHNYADPVRATRTIPVMGRLIRYEGRGSDPEPVYEWTERTEHGWERECVNCGHTEYTTKMKPVFVGHVPDFGA